MKTKRLIIETSVLKKVALEKVLQEQGKTLTDWFADKVEESVYPYLSNFKQDPAEDLLDSNDLKNPTLLFNRLQNQDWSFTDDDTAYLSHNIHPYPAKYIPQIPNRLIRMLSCKGDLVWDPFGGSGTTALEALLLGRQAISSDLNPVAAIIGTAKTKSITKSEENEINALIDRINVLLRNQDTLEQTFTRNYPEIRRFIPEIVNMEKWFHPNAINELGMILWMIDARISLSLKSSINAVFSKIIIKVSFQDSETRYVSIPRDIVKGYTLKLFVSELTSYLNKVRHLPRFLNFRKAEFITENILTSNLVKPNSIDLIVTSPPYPNATDYHLYHRFRLLWLGFDPKIMAISEIGSHLRHQKEFTGIEDYNQEMKICLLKFFKALRSGRFAVIVIGDALFKGQVYDTAELLGAIAQSIGFELIGIIPRTVHQTKRSFSAPARRLRSENLLVLRKPDVNSWIELVPPPYKLWNYEDEIRKFEIKNILGHDLIDSDANFQKIFINSLDVNKLKRLTFTHYIRGSTHNQEQTWQSILENGDASNGQSNRKDPKYITHGIHAYKGKFYPQLAKSLLNLGNIQSGSHVLDPFCGSGTVLLEGFLNGMNCTGFDINPIALKIARVKTEIIKLDPFIVDNLLNEFIQSIERLNVDRECKNIFNPTVLPELESWFPEPVLWKLGGILRLINDCPEPIIAEFFEVCLSSIVREISQQDPKDLRIRRRKVPIEDAPVIEYLLKKLKDQRERLIKFAEKTIYSPNDFQSTHVYNGDCRFHETFSNVNIKDNSIDVVITSPPYATALPYIDTDRLSILLLFGKKSAERMNLEKSLIGAREITKTERDEFELKIVANDFQGITSLTAIEIIQTVFNANSNSEIGFRKRNTASLLYRYFHDMSMVFSALNKIVKQEGTLFFVIGDNKTETDGIMLSINSGIVLKEIGINLGWKVVDIIPITVTQENRFHNKNGITKNDILWFKK